MNTELWLALLGSALGTLLLRLGPLLWMRRRQGVSTQEQAIPEWLGVLGPMMIAAMFGVSLVPPDGRLVSWVAAAIGLLATWAVWWRTRSLGWPVAAGVLAYGLIVALV